MEAHVFRFVVNLNKNITALSGVCRHLFFFMSPIDSFKSDLSALGISLCNDDIKKIIDDIFLNKQFTQKDMRILKQNYVECYSDFLILVMKYQKNYLADLTIVSDEDAIPFE